MKKLIASLGFLLVATASHGEAGQHTGVGGNPAPAVPPQPSGFTIPPTTFQSLILQPGLVFIFPDQLAEPQDDQEPQQDMEQPDDAAE